MPRQQPLEPQVQVQNKTQQVSDSDEANTSTPGSATDSSLDTSSIEVIQPNEGLEIRLPIDPPQRAPPNFPELSMTNIAVPVPDHLLTEDEETGDETVPPTVAPTSPDPKGRQETLSPTPHVPQSVWSAIELTAKDLEQQVNRDFDHLSNSNWKYTTAQEQLYPDPHYLKDDKQTQTELTLTPHIQDTGAQYSSPSDSSDSSASNSDSDIEGTENITVAKHYLHRHSVSSEDLYTNPMPPNKRFRTSTPDPTER